MSEQKLLWDLEKKVIAQKFHAFRSGEDVNKLGKYYVTTTEEIAKQEYILTTGRYVGVAEEEGRRYPI